MKADYTQTIDGKTYKRGDEIWDLGSWIAVEAKGMIRNYVGLAEDESKLPHYVSSGSTALCLDTGDVYSFLASKDTWYKL